MKYSKLSYIRQSFLLVVIMSCMSCDRVDYFPDNPIQFKKTIFFAHHGGGDYGAANTLKSCKYGLDNLNGIECDIQISSEGTLWLSHSSQTESCSTFTETNFASQTDAQIEAVNACLGSENEYCRLDSVFNYMSKKNSGELISLDVKAWEPDKLENADIIDEMNRLAQSIINLVSKYGLSHQVMVESETGDFLYYIKTHSDNIETYLSTDGDFELGTSRALKAGFTGISFKYKFDEEITLEQIQLIHRKGLKIHLWTVDDLADINEALSIQPDYIQTDNVNYVMNLNY